MWWLKWNFCIVNRTLLTPDNPWLCFECWTSLLEPAVGERQKRSEWKNVNKVNSEFWDEKGEPEMGVSDESCVGAQKSKRNPLWVQWDEGLSTNYVILYGGEGQKLEQQQKVMHFINVKSTFLVSHNVIYEQPLVFCSMIGSEVTVK